MGPVALNSAREEAKPRRGRPRDPTLDHAILGAAQRLLFETGVQGFSLLEVARRAGVPKSTVYRRWGSQRELLRATLADIETQANQPVPDTGSLRDDLVAVLRRRIERLGMHEYRLARIGLEARDDPELTEIVRGVVDRRRRAYYPIFARALERGELRPGIDFDAAIDLAFGGLWSRLVTQRAVDPSEAEAMIDDALHGLTGHGH